MTIEPSMMICPSCSGTGNGGLAFVAGVKTLPDGTEVPDHYATENSKCVLCRGTGVLSQQRLEWRERGRACQQMRAAHGMMINDAAVALGVRSSEISNMEFGRSDPTRLEQFFEIGKEFRTVNEPRKPTIKMIAAVSADSVIGVGKDIPWRQRADMLRFKKLTTGHIVVMGSTTALTLPKSLPDRVNVIMTRQPIGIPRTSYPKEPMLHEFSVMVNTFDEVLALQREHYPQLDIFIIGGGQIYKELLPVTDEVLLTEIDVHIGDKPDVVKFPRDDLERLFRRDTFSQFYEPDAQNQFTYSFETYIRKPSTT